MKSIDSGTLAFGLVSIPIKLYAAAVSRKAKFSLLDGKTRSRVKQQLVPTADPERVVERDELLKGYEYARGQFVVFEQEELKKLEADTDKSIDIQEIVPANSLDLLGVEHSYFLGPDRGGDKSFQLLAQTLKRLKKVAVAKWARRGKEQLVVVRPYQGGLVLHQMFYGDEIRDYNEVPRTEMPISAAEREMAEMLVKAMSTDAFDPSQYEDAFTKRVQEAVDQKIAGNEIVLPTEGPKANVVDLMEALSKSLIEAEKVEKAAKGKKGRKKKG